MAGILVYDGVTHAATGKVWGRIKGAGILPVSEGWLGVALGLLEAAVGLCLVYRFLFRRSR